MISNSSKQEKTFCKLEKIFASSMFVETLKCHGKEVRTGLDDKEIEWRAFTYIWIFECVNKKYKRYTKEIQKKYTRNTKEKGWQGNRMGSIYIYLNICPFPLPTANFKPDLFWGTTYKKI